VTTTLYTDTVCTTAPSVVAAGQCATESTAQSLLATAAVSGTPACAPSGGAPSGMVVPETPVTICCPP
jgi:hypothetical protein